MEENKADIFFGKNTESRVKFVVAFQMLKIKQMIRETEAKGKKETKYRVVRLLPAAINPIIEEIKKLGYNVDEIKDEEKIIALRIWKE